MQIDMTARDRLDYMLGKSLRQIEEQADTMRAKDIAHAQEVQGLQEQIAELKKAVGVLASERPSGGPG